MSGAVTWSLLVQRASKRYWAYEIIGGVLTIRSGGPGADEKTSVERLGSFASAYERAEQLAHLQLATGFKRKEAPPPPAIEAELAMHTESPPPPPRRRRAPARKPADDLEALDAARRELVAHYKVGGGGRDDLDQHTLEAKLEDAWKRLGRPDNNQPELVNRVRTRFARARADDEHAPPDRWADVLVGIAGAGALPDLFEAVARAPDRVPRVSRALLNDLVSRHPIESRAFLEPIAKQRGARAEIALLALSWLEA